MKRIILTIICIVLFPSIIYADIAWPVATKDQACKGQDGFSWDRLQIFLNNKKSDTLYYHKYQNQLFYTISTFPYLYPVKDYNGQNSKQTFYSAIFLYKYDCNDKKPIRISNNLKWLVSTVWWPVNGEEKISQNIRRELSYGQVDQVTNTWIIVSLFIPQTGIVTNSIIIPYK